MADKNIPLPVETGIVVATSALTVCPRQNVITIPDSASRQEALI